MRIVYPLLWSRLDRKACGDQSVSTAAALARQGVQVTLLLPRRDDDPALRPGEVRRWFAVSGDFDLIQRPSRWAGTSLFRSALWLRQLLRDPAVRAADILYSRMPLMLGAGRLSPIPFAVDHYRPWPDDWPLARPAIRATARQPHCLGFVLHSAYAADSYLRLGVAPDKILVAHNGADLERMPPSSEPAQARMRLGLPLDRKIAVYAGSINAAKGLDQLLALAELRPETLFLLVGSRERGSIEAEAERRPNVRLIPWQAPDTLPDYLHAGDVLLVPASTAPLRRFRNCVLPLKIFSYLAAGRPILAPLSPDTAELLRDGENALLVPPDLPGAAAAGLDRLLHEPGLASRLAGAARDTAETLTWDDRAKKILAFLRRRGPASADAGRVPLASPADAPGSVELAATTAAARQA